jgi:hypothetical protein
MHQNGFALASENFAVLHRNGMKCAILTGSVLAIRFAGAVMHDEPDVLWDGRDYRVEVTNEADDLLFTIVMLSIDAPASHQA